MSDAKLLRNTIDRERMHNAFVFIFVHWYIKKGKKPSGMSIGQTEV